jgi:hypothetical protein
MLEKQKMGCLGSGVNRRFLILSCLIFQPGSNAEFRAWHTRQMVRTIRWYFGFAS